MQIKYLTHIEINKQKWDKCISKAFNGILYAYSWYLDIVSPEWDALVDENYTTVLPLTWRKKFGIKYLYQPPFTQQLGIFTTNALNEYIINEFISKIPSKFKLIEINLNSFNNIYDNNNVRIKKNRNIELDLIEPYNNIFNKFNNNTKRNIKKSENNNLTLTKNGRPEDVIDIFRNNRGKKINNLRNREYKTLAYLLYRLLNTGYGQIWSVLNQKNEICASVFFAFSNNKIIFLFSGTTNEGKKNLGMFYLINKFIEENSEKNLTLDFEGSNNDNLARFYLSFGAKECSYPQIKINRLPIPFKWFK